MNSTITGRAYRISGGPRRGWPRAASRHHARETGRHRHRARWCRPGFTGFRRLHRPASRRAIGRAGGHGADRVPRSRPGRMRRAGGPRGPPAGGGKPGVHSRLAPG